MNSTFVAIEISRGLNMAAQRNFLESWRLTSVIYGRMCLGISCLLARLLAALCLDRCPVHGFRSTGHHDSLAYKYLQKHWFISSSTC